MACVTKTCSSDENNTAFFHQVDNVNKFMNYALANTKSYVISQIPSGKAIHPGENIDVVTSGVATISETPYEEVSRGNPGVYVMGEMKGSSPCDCGTATYKVPVNTLDRGGCNPKYAKVNIAQGFGRSTSREFRIGYNTDIRCINDLATLNRAQQKTYYEEEAKSFVNHGINSLDKHLAQVVVRFGGANSAVFPFDGKPFPDFTEGGWAMNSDPNDPVTGILPISLHFLRQYKIKWARHKMIYDGDDALSSVLKVQMSRQAFNVALQYEMLTRSSRDGIFEGKGENIRLEYGKVEEAGVMKGREYVQLDGIRIFFDDSPPRCHAMPNGVNQLGMPNYGVVDIPQWITAPGGTAGLVSVPNKDYFSESVCRDGIWYKVLDKIMIIDKTSFRRHLILPTVAPKGMAPKGYDFPITLLHGASLSSQDCPNPSDDKYMLFCENRYKLNIIRPELSGFILSAVAFDKGYDIRATRSRPDCGPPPTISATPQYCDVPMKPLCKDPCNPEPECTEAENVIEISPCGTVSTAYYGAPSTMQVRVTRSFKCCDLAASVLFTITDETAVNGVHYAPVGSASEAINWSAGESGTKYIQCIIKGAFPADQPKASFSIHLVGVTGGVLSANKDVTVEINNYA